MQARETSYELGGIKFEGISVAGEETCIIIPQFKVVFDIGRCPQRATTQQTVLLSHGHLDHIGGLPFHTHTRHMHAVSPSNIVVNPAYVDPVKNFLIAAAGLQFEECAPYTLKALEPGDATDIPKGFRVKAFRTFHRVPSQGYVLYTTRKKLRQELQGLSGSEIRDIKLAGGDVVQTIEVPEVAFTGDTSAELFAPGAADEDIFRAKVLFLECTFVDDEVSEKEATDRGHMHLKQIAANVDRFQNDHVVLIHFSPRHSADQIQNAIQKLIPPAHQGRFKAFLNGFR